MKTLGLDGKEYVLNLNGKLVSENSMRQCSSGHKLARTLLCRLFPFDRIYEEVTVQGCGNPMYLDFIIPGRKLVIEVQGEQHRTASKFFGGNGAFKKQLHRDKKKENWCSHNNLILVKLDDNRTDGWESTIRNVFTENVD